MMKGAFFMHLKKFIKLETIFQDIDFMQLYKDSHEDKVLIATRLSYLSSEEYRYCYEYLDYKLAIASRKNPLITMKSFENMITRAPLKDRTINRFLLSSFILGILYTLFLSISNLILVLNLLHYDIYPGLLPTNYFLVIQWVLMIVGDVFCGIGTFKKKQWSSLTGLILYASSIIVYPPLCLVTIMITIFSLVGYHKQYHD